MSRRIRLAAVLVAAALVLVVSAVSVQAAPLTFAPCQATETFVHVPGLQCGTLDVPFDRGDAAAGTIALAVQRVPASAPRVGVIVLLAGGPGQSALAPFEESLAPLAREPALRGFELVSFDQRGTGQSEGLQCLEPEGSLEGGLAAYLGFCGDALGATRGFYTSQESVEDLDALRQALGGTPLSLWSVSYGGHVAGMYALEHPQGVARMVLDSPVPVSGGDPLFRERLHALRRVLDEGICGAGACSSFTHDLYGDLTRLVATLHRHPLRTRIYNGRGRLQATSVTEAGVFKLLLGVDLDVGVRELAPAAIAAAAHGDAAPLARLTRSLQAEPPGAALAGELADRSGLGDGRTGSLGSAPEEAHAPLSEAGSSMALYDATYCDESELPWSPASAPSSRAETLRGWLAALPSASTAPFAATTVAANAPVSLCMDWPATAPAPAVPAGVSAVPTLILSGDQDLRTPYEQDLTVAGGYSDVQLLRVPDVGHSTVTEDQTGCARRAMIEFLASGQAPQSCAESHEPQALALPPARLADVRPLPSRSRLVGRVAAAAAITLEDLWGQSGLSGGGLRGGYWRYRAGKVQLHDFVDVPGVILSGSISSSGAAHFTVRGRLSGTLTQKGPAVRGRIDGMPIHLRLVDT